jgi:tetratricopeptide (TPR) repeat protein
MTLKIREFSERVLPWILLVCIFILGISFLSALGSQLPAAEKITLSTDKQAAPPDKQIADALETLKERASAQQTMIQTLITITSLYAVILSIVAYVRLQQIKEDTKEAIADNSQRLDKAIARLSKQLDDLGTEVRADVPAVHGVGRRLEELLAELQQRLPVDASATTKDKSGALTFENVEQVAIDEMVINSLDIFNIRKDVGKVRTVSQLYIALGQFYFVKSKYHQDLKEPSSTQSCFAKAKIYFEKATEIDPSDPVAWRARGALSSWEAFSKMENLGLSEHDPKMLAHVNLYYSKSLELDNTEPGALDGMVWLCSVTKKPNEAIKYATRLIDSGAIMTTQHKRKYLLFAYLHRARLRAEILTNSTNQTSEVAKTIEQIEADLNLGNDVAIALSAQPAFKQLLKTEFLSKVTFESLSKGHESLNNMVSKILDS